MALAIKNLTITDEEGNVVSGATVTVRDEATGRLARLFSDRDGTDQISNPFTAGDDGHVQFHVQGGAYSILARKGNYERQWRYEPIGTAQEVDVEALAAFLETGTVSFRTKDDLDQFAPEPGQYMLGAVQADPDPSLNGYYTWDAVGEEWEFARPFPETLARLVNINGSANARTADAFANTASGAVTAFFGFIDEANTGPMTLSINGEGARPVVNAAGNPLSSGEFQGGVLFFLNDDGDYQLINDAGAAASAAQSASEAAAARDEAVAVAPSTWQDLRDETVAARDEADGFAGDASDEADRAEAARDAAQLSAGVYADTAAGLAATSSGDYFSVPSTEDDEYLILYKNDAGSAVEQRRYPSVSGVYVAAAVMTEEARALGARAATVRHPQHGMRPVGAKISWRPAPGDKAPPSGWTWTGGGSGERWSWDADGTLRKTANGFLRHWYAAPALDGDGRWLGVMLGEPYSQNKSSAATLAGTVAGSPGTLPTGVSEVSGSAGLTRTIATGSEAGCAYLELAYTGTASADYFDVDFGAAVSDYLNASDASVSVAAGQSWTFSAYAKVIGEAVGLGSIYPYVRQGTGETTLGSHTIPLLDKYHPWYAVRALTGTPGTVVGGVRIEVENGQPVDFSVRIILPQLEPKAGMSSPIPVVDGQRYQESVSLPRNSDAFLSRWGSSKDITLYGELIEPYWNPRPTAGRFMYVTDSSTGGRISLGDGVNNEIYVVGANWDGSAQTVVAFLNTYHDFPGSIMRVAASNGTGGTIAVRDNHRTIKSSGAVFTATQPAGLDIGGFTTSRSMLFREVALWDHAMDEGALRRMARNFENELYVDTFSRPDAADGSLGATEVGGISWEPYGFNESYSEPGRPAHIASTELAVDYNDPDGGDVVIATYSRLTLPHSVRRMGAAVIWRDTPNRTVETASVALISTQDDRLRIAAITGAEGGPGSVHNVWLINTLDAGTFTGGTDETDEAFPYAKLAYDTVAWIGQVFWGGRCWLVDPYGSLIEPAESEHMWSLRGRYCTWEHFRTGHTALDISNAVQMPMVAIG